MRSSRGFTLIELLVVIGILAMLMGVGAFSYSKFIGRGDHAKTVATVESLKGLLEQYRNATGDYPKSRLADYGIKPRNGLYEGVEAMVIGLYHKDYDGERVAEKELRNLDSDRGDVNVSIHGEPVLLEVVDAWENPLVYMRYDDFERTHEYEFQNNHTGDFDTVSVKAARNELTGSFFAKESYQLISVGEDGIFGTEDDITSF